MRKSAKSTTSTAVAALVGAGLLGGVLVAAAPADASPAASHLSVARADWVKGSKASAAVEGKYWHASSVELSHYGSRYRVQRQELAGLIAIPNTSTTPEQRADATRWTRELNVFFHTPGLYGVKPAPSHLSLARADWVRSGTVASVDRDTYLHAAARQLAVYGTRFATQRKHLDELAALPSTGLTNKQQARAASLIRALNAFFHTHVG